MNPLAPHHQHPPLVTSPSTLGSHTVSAATAPSPVQRVLVSSDDVIRTVKDPETQAVTCHPTFSSGRADVQALLLGVQINVEDFRTIKATYYRIALDLIEAYYNDALMNGLKLDRHSEEQAVELFADNLMEAGKAFLEHPRDKPFIPSWNRVLAAFPDLLERMHEAVELDNAGEV